MWRPQPASRYVATLTVLIGLAISLSLAQTTQVNDRPREPAERAGRDRTRIDSEDSHQITLLNKFLSTNHASFSHLMGVDR